MARRLWSKLTAEEAEQVWVRLSDGHLVEDTVTQLQLPLSIMRTYLVRCVGIQSRRAAAPAGGTFDVGRVGGDHARLCSVLAGAGAGARPSRRVARWKDRLHSSGDGKVNLDKFGYPIGALQAAI